MSGREVRTALPKSLADLHPDVWTDPFWEAANRLELTAPRCTSCGTFRMPPGPFCWRCRAQDIEWVTLPGTATVYSFTVVRQAVMPDLADAVPYVVAVVDLDGAPDARLVAALVEVEPDAVRIGDRVAVAWERLEDDVVIPRLVPQP